VPGIGLNDPPKNLRRTNEVTCKDIIELCGEEKPGLTSQVEEPKLLVHPGCGSG
jgi:hypothetical protein